MSKKNVKVATILSMIFPGLGLIYDEENTKALKYLILGIILLIILIYIAVTGLFQVEDLEDAILVVIYSYIIVWLISLYDTFATTRLLNM